MNYLQSLCLLVSLISTCAAYKCGKICIFDDRSCVTSGGSTVYRTSVNGIKGVIEPLDPLYIDEIDGVMDSVKYKLTNITLIGLKTCEVSQLIINATLSTYKQYLYCPKFISTFQFEAAEDSDSPGLRGKGVATVVSYDYDVLNEGDYGVFVKDDHKPHFFVNPPETTSHLNGHLTFEISKGYLVDNNTDSRYFNIAFFAANETEQYLNNNWRETEEFLLTPIIRRAMLLVMRNIDAYCKTYTIDEVLPEASKSIFQSIQDIFSG